MARSLKFTSIILILSLFAIGLFHEYLSCAASIALGAYLIVTAIRRREIVIKINLVGAAVAVTVLFYLLTALWAVDSGMALMGFAKYLPVLLFLIALQQTGYSDDIKTLLPLSAVFMTVISSVLSFIPDVSSLCTVSGRLSGFFQYSNTFALFLLISLIVLLSGQEIHLREIIFALILLGGIFYSGSRTVFVLTALSVAALAVMRKEKVFRITVISLFLTGLAAAAVYAAVTGNLRNVSRFMTISLKESTFIGRILYYRDALPVILRHPFGLGHMGYYYMQQSFQSGVYSVMFIHNDFLQLLLDVGWIPGLLIAAAAVKAFFAKGIAPSKRLMILVFTLHSCFDFNFAFVGMFMLYIYLLSWDSGKEIRIKHIPVAVCAYALAVIVSLYFGIAQFLTYIKNDEAAVSFYPLNTVSQIRLLTDTEETDSLKEISDSILERNKYVSVAYSAIARYYYSKGDFEKVFKYKNLVFEYAPYQTAEYEEYCYMLIMGVSLYRQNGDEQSASYCLAELYSVEDILNEVNERTSNFGRMIKDKPKLTLNKEILTYISEAKAEEKK